MIRVQAWNEVVSPKFYGPLTIWSWLKISPQSSLNVIYLIITAWQWLMSFPYMPCIPMQIKPIKACQGKPRGPLPLREWPCHPFSSTGLGSPCGFVLSQPQHHGHCLLVTASFNEQGPKMLRHDQILKLRHGSKGGKKHCDKKFRLKFRPFQEETAASLTTWEAILAPFNSTFIPSPG